MLETIDCEFQTGMNNLFISYAEVRPQLLDCIVFNNFKLIMISMMMLIENIFIIISRLPKVK